MNSPISNELQKKEGTELDQWGESLKGSSRKSRNPTMQITNFGEKQIRGKSDVGVIFCYLLLSRDETESEVGHFVSSMKANMLILCLYRRGHTLWRDMWKYTQHGWTRPSYSQGTDFTKGKAMITTPNSLAKRARRRSTLKKGKS